MKKVQWKESVTVKTDREASQELEIQRDIRQGCILSRLLFKVYSEEISQWHWQTAEKRSTLEERITSVIRRHSPSFRKETSLHIRRCEQNSQEYGNNEQTKKEGGSHFEDMKLTNYRDFKWTTHRTSKQIQSI